MDQAELEALFRQLSGMRSRGHHQTQDALGDALVAEGCLKTPEVIRAFRAVDRKHYLNPEVECPYADTPIRDGKLHQSAPSVYAQALEALELSPGMSFLNIGSGTGYFSALVAQIIGAQALNVGVERTKELVEFSEARCKEAGLEDIQFKHGNCFDIDVENSMRFDRIYVGAGAPRDARFLFKLLKYDGVVVGPFDDEEMVGHQSLTKARCRGGKKFAVSKLLAVSFAELVRPEEEHSKDAGFARTKLILGAPQWDVSRRTIFPPEFQRMVMFFYWMNCLEGTLPSKLPWELWTKFIITFLPFDAFSKATPKLEKICAVCNAPGAASQCGSCKTVRYCSRECQRNHWPVHKKECGRPLRDKES